MNKQQHDQLQQELVQKQQELALTKQLGENGIDWFYIYGSLYNKYKGVEFIQRTKQQMEEFNEYSERIETLVASAVDREEDGINDDIDGIKYHLNQPVTQKATTLTIVLTGPDRENQRLLDAIAEYAHYMDSQYIFSCTVETGEKEVEVDKDENEDDENEEQDEDTKE